MKRFLIVSDPLRDLIAHLPPQLKKRIKGALTEILASPCAGKALKAELEGLRSYKLKKIRIVYRLETSSIVLIALGPRKTIYETIALEIKRAQAKPSRKW